MFHQDDIVEEIETKRQGRITEAPKIPTDTRRWRVEFSDGKKPKLRYFLESDLRLITCPHGITPKRGPVSREEDEELILDVAKEMEPCKREGCGHPVSVHNTYPAEKRAQLRGLPVSDFPSSHREEFNIQAGKANSACDEPDCQCVAYISPRG